jgi:hypothetical protein
MNRQRLLSSTGRIVQADAVEMRQPSLDDLTASWVDPTPWLSES